jgi:hypothetical protein
MLACAPYKYYRICILNIFMSYKGRYSPKNPQKYKGDVKNIIYRSSWELKFMIYCDNNVNILEWGSEEIFIPYISPADGKKHRYFPDFYIKTKSKTGEIKKYLVEVKPEYQVRGPKVQQRRTKQYINEVITYAVNQAKWKAAKEFCNDHLWEFIILTEKELKV